MSHLVDYASELAEFEDDDPAFLIELLNDLQAFDKDDGRKKAEVAEAWSGEKGASIVERFLRNVEQDDNLDAEEEADLHFLAHRASHSPKELREYNANYHGGGADSPMAVLRESRQRRPPQQESATSPVSSRRRASARHARGDAEATAVLPDASIATPNGLESEPSEEEKDDRGVPEEEGLFERLLRLGIRSEPANRAAAAPPEATANSEGEFSEYEQAAALLSPQADRRKGRAAAAGISAARNGAKSAKGPVRWTREEALRTASPQRDFVRHAADAAAAVPSYALPTKHFAPLVARAATTANGVRREGGGSSRRATQLAAELEADEALERLLRRCRRAEKETQTLTLRLEGQRGALHETEHRLAAMKVEAACKDDEISRLRRKIAAFVQLSGAASAAGERCARCGSSRWQQRDGDGDTVAAAAAAAATATAALQRRLTEAENKAAALDRQSRDGRAREQRLRGLITTLKGSLAAAQDRAELSVADATALRAEVDALRNALLQLKREMRAEARNAAAKEKQQRRKQPGGGVNAAAAAYSAREEASAKAQLAQQSKALAATETERDTAKSGQRALRKEVSRLRGEVSTLESENRALVERLHAQKVARNAEISANRVSYSRKEEGAGDGGATSRRRSGREKDASNSEVLNGALGQLNGNFGPAHGEVVAQSSSYEPAAEAERRNAPHGEWTEPARRERTFASKSPFPSGKDAAPRRADAQAKVAASIDASAGKPSSSRDANRTVEVQRNEDLNAAREAAPLPRAKHIGAAVSLTGNLGLGRQERRGANSPREATATAAVPTSPSAASSSMLSDRYRRLQAMYFRVNPGSGSLPR